MSCPMSFPLDNELQKRDTTLFGFPLFAPSATTISHKRRQLDAVASAYNPPSRSAPKPPSTPIDFFHRHTPRPPSPQSTSDTIVTRKTASVTKSQDARLDLSPLSMLFEAIIADVDGDENAKEGEGIDRESVSDRCNVGTTDTSSEATSKGSLGGGGVKRGWEGDTFPCSPGHTDTSSVMLSNMSRSLAHDVSRVQAYRSSRGSATRSSRINTHRSAKSTVLPTSNRISDHQAFPYKSRLSLTTSTLRSSSISDPITPQPEESFPLLHAPLSRPVSSTLSTATFPTLLPLTPTSPIINIGTMLDSTLTSLLAHHAQFSPPPMHPGQDSLLFSSFPTARGASVSRSERQTHESGIVDTNHLQLAPPPRDSFGTVWNPSPPPTATTATAVDRSLRVSPPRPARPAHCRDTLEDFTPFTVSPVAFQSPCLKSIRKAPREYLRLETKGRESVEEVQQVAKKREGAEKELKKFKLAPAPPAIPRKASGRKSAARTGKNGEKDFAAAKSSSAVAKEVDVQGGKSRVADDGRWRSSALSVQTFVSALSVLDTVDYNDVPLYTNRSVANEREQQVESKTRGVHEPVQLKDEPMEVLNTIASPAQLAPLRRPPYKQTRCQPSKPPPPQVAKKPSLIRKLSASLRMSPRPTIKNVHVGGATDYSKLPLDFPPTSIVIPPPYSAPPTRRPTINVVRSNPSLSGVSTHPHPTTSVRMRSFSHTSAPSPTPRPRKPSSSSTPPSTTKTRTLASTSSTAAVALKPSLKRNASLSSTGTTHTSASHSSRLKRRPSRTTIVGSASECVGEIRAKKSVTFGGVIRIGSMEKDKEEKEKEKEEEKEEEDGELREMLCGGRKIGPDPEEVVEIERSEQEVAGGAGTQSDYVSSIKGLLGSFTSAIGGWRRSPS
ncbi:hypothetical protein PHSY_002520 [Pseudozyma hubeiensis SY62]|uniref:Uncharacterized protein n=1 Tax=Pseudozyma hubeiensis (strain SY62) TaxID=1305764 RepID=R9P1F6_PSEHS|nr:hypothetical protein PHSY_002520 [Pseudozyma hubeiensis SY62]GAC94947.1 hypothetical protein PHSY_002520 [Pseudozyma hubeiensis SY62]